MRILFLGNPNHQFIKNLAFELKKKNTELIIDIISIPYSTKIKDNSFIYDNIFYLGTRWKFFQRIPYLKNFYFTLNLINVLRSIKSYEIVSIQFPYYFYFFVFKEIKEKAQNLYLSFWGSDYNKLNFWQKNLLKKFSRKSDGYTVANEEFKQTLIDNLEIPEHKFHLARFGLAPLKPLSQLIKDISQGEAQSTFGIRNKFVITVGYNADKIHQHRKIIDLISKIEEELPTNYLLLFPMTYGSQNRSKYILSTKRRLDKLDLKYKILDKYLSDEEVAKLRIASNVMINLPQSDQFSGSMQEHLYAKNIVITGSWLPYSTFIKQGITFIEIKTVFEIGEKLVEVIRDYEKLLNKCSGNPKIIWEMSSWDKTISGWENIFLYKRIYLN